MKTVIGFVCGVVGFALAVVMFIVGVIAGFSFGISEKVNAEKKKPEYRGYFKWQNDQKGEH